MEMGATDFLEQLEASIDNDHQAAIVQERDVASGFLARCKALERSFYWGTAMEGARAVTYELFTAVGGYDTSISSGEDLFINKLYLRRTLIATPESLFLRHYLGSYSIASLLKKKFSYGRTARSYLRRAHDVGAVSAPVIIRTSVAAYIHNWPAAREHPLEYASIFPLRALELIAVQLGMWLGHRDQSP
jgi:hypothetical protein